MPLSKFSQFPERKQDKQVEANQLPAGRFPPPWTVEELETCFAVKDTRRAKTGVCLFRGVAGRRSAKLLTRDEARKLWSILPASGACREIISGLL